MDHEAGARADPDSCMHAGLSLAPRRMCHTLNAFRGEGAVVEECQGVSARQWAWAVAGLVAAGGAAVLGLLLSVFLAGLFIVSAAAAAVPLLAREQPKAFARTCLVIGTGLLAWALIGAVIGMFLFLPAALSLLVAAFVDSDNRPGAWFAVTVPLAGAFASALIVLPSDPDNEPPPYFNAALDSTSRFYDREFNERKERLRDFGATPIQVAESAGRLKLHVGMPERFQEGQSQGEPREEIDRLPGVVDVRLCTFHTCDW
ncbi:hypothetical protein ACH4XT_10390 [Streptomyces avidinii]|uniref:hypothetical protein n=1 Tax=Streptomyces avidinii TaxID=1895 RepID=UPI0037A20D37